MTEGVRALVGGKPEGFKGNSWFIFSTTNGKRPFSGFSKAKRALDAEIAANRKKSGQDDMPRWTLHDLRWTGRSMMSRAKVSSDHAERVMGHVIGGVRETYDRYAISRRKTGCALRASCLSGGDRQFPAGVCYSIGRSVNSRSQLVSATRRSVPCEAGPAGVQARLPTSTSCPPWSALQKPTIHELLKI